MYRLICHSAGYPIIYLLQNLRKLRLFAPREDFTDRADLVSYAGSQQNLNAPVPASATSSMKMLLSFKSRY